MNEKIEGKLYFMCGLALGIVVAFLLGCFVAGITAQPTDDVGSTLPLTDDGYSDWSPCWCMHRADDGGLVSGWNLIGICSNQTEWASSLAGGIDGCSIISMFDASQQSYRSYFVGGPQSFDFPLFCGMGLFVLVEV